MALCAICQTMPFDSMPDFPAYDGWYGINDDSDLPVLVRIRYADTAPLVPKVLGFPWQNLEQLAASAARSACPICSLVQRGVEIWMDRYREAARKGWKHWEPDVGDSDVVPNDKPKLWLAKREGGGDGFVVLAWHKHEQEFAILCGVSLSVDADSPLADHFPQRPINRDSGSAPSQDVAAAWLERCVKTHVRCRQSSGDMPLPSRVLDVGAAAADRIKLIQCTFDMRAKYACLSHCWGLTDLLRTTRATYSARISGIPMAHLPRSFADAVVLTRRLGLRFLWIDSLCIVQDDRQDWVRESSRMATVYSQAYVVLAANRAENSAAGMFHKHEPRPAAVVAGLPGLPMVPSRDDADVAKPSLDLVHLQLVYPREDKAGDTLEPWCGREFEGEPLATRGWALQERVLARRLLHFNGRQMYYECDEGGLVGENGTRNARSYEIRYRDGHVHDSEGGVQMDQSAPSQDTWYQLIAAYGKRKLSKTTDKLPAMSGLAKLCQGLDTRQYVAGLWSDRLIEGLAWQGLDGQRPATSYIGPSWSWASYDGIAMIHIVEAEAWRDVAQVIGWHVDLENVANPYGEVKDASIRLQAPLTRLSVSKLSPTYYDLEELDFRWPKMCTMYSQDEEECTFCPDYPDTWRTREAMRNDFHVLVIMGLESRTNNKDLERLFGLVVVPVGEDKQEPRTMKRIGWTRLVAETCKKVMSDTENRTTVTLV